MEGVTWCFFPGPSTAGELFFYFSPVTMPALPALPALLYRRYLTSAANSAKLIASIN
jgi:hypothetical protein